jgi:hypothetical protein
MAQLHIQVRLNLANDPDTGDTLDNLIDELKKLRTIASVDGQAITLAGQQKIVHGPHICRNSIVGEWRIE